ncbi:MAG TPA: serine/threonine-protein kinase [Streptomyces sp.]|nr:serine/threonine-protein kinase [Streptomyces sp.]
MDTAGERHDGQDGTGRLLAGRYRTVRRLGRGGMGVVWEATDEVLGRQVALKELRTFSDAPPEQVGDLTQRMRREARAAARVRHPGVVAVHDIAEHEGRPVIVMELVDGPSLDDVLRRDGPLHPAEAARVGAEVLRALGAAHRAGVLHRDVKPGNVLLERSGRVVLTDFGIAAVEDPADGATTSLTGTGDLVGSLDYLAPERARGEKPGPPSDVGSLGATLYAAVEGASPFRRTSTWSTLTAIVVEPLPEPRRAGPLGPVLAQFLHKDPAQRPDADRAAEMLAAVAAGGAGAAGAVADAGVTETMQLGRVPAAAARPVQPAERDTAEQTVSTRGREAAGRRRRGPVVAAAVAAVLLAGGGAGWALASGGDDGTRTTASEAGAGAPAPSKSPGHSADAKEGASSPSPRESDTASASPSAAPAEHDEGDEAKPSSHPPAKPTARPSPTDTNGGGGGVPGPSCHSIGGGKFNCQVWRTAASYREPGRDRAGVLNAGTNYFFCQEKSTQRETSGQYTNVWWAKTDDDSGNANVWVSDVYLKGGANDQPVPGLPVC